MIEPAKLQVLLTVLQRAPASLAEQIICEEVAEQLLAMIEPPPVEPPVEPQTEPPLAHANGTEREG